MPGQKNQSFDISSVAIESEYPMNSYLETYQWPWYSQGVRMVFADQCWHKSMAPLMESVREQMGNMPVYLTFDIDGIDLTACPGTGKSNLQTS